MSKYGHTIEVDGDVESTKQFVSTVIGMAPLIVASSLLVANLFAENSDKLDGEHGSYYLDAANLTNKYTTLSGWGITDAWTKVEADARYRGSTWAPTLDEVLTAGNTSNKSVNLNGYGDRAFYFYDMNVYNGGHLGILDGYPELKLGSVTLRYENSAIEVSGGHLRTLNGDPSNPNDLARKAYVDAGLALKYNIPAGTTAQYVRGDGSLAAFPSIPSVTPAALTRTSDTNVVLTLGGTPNTALLQAVSITASWTGTLSVDRGGSGAATLTGILVGNGASAFTGVAGTANQLLRRNAANTAYEFFTPTYLTANQAITLSGDVTGSGTTAITATIANSVITNAKIRNSAALSVIGRSANSTGVVADIAAATDGHVLRRAGTVLGFGTIGDASISALAWGKLTGVPTTLSGFGLQTEADNRYVNVTGDTMTGNLIIKSAITGKLSLINTADVAGAANLIFANTSGNNWQVGAYDGGVDGNIDFWAANLTWMGEPLATRTWVSANPVAHNLGSHTDVTIASPVTNQYLGYNGSGWVNMTLPAGSVQNLSWAPSTGELSISGGTGANLDGRYLRILRGHSANINSETSAGQGYWNPTTTDSNSVLPGAYGMWVNFTAIAETPGSGDWGMQFLIPSDTNRIRIRRLSAPSTWGITSDLLTGHTGIATVNGIQQASGNHTGLDADTVNPASVLHVEPVSNGPNSLTTGILQTFGGGERRYQLFTGPQGDNHYYRSRLTAAGGYGSWYQAASRAWVTTTLGSYATTASLSGYVNTTTNQASIAGWKGWAGNHTWIPESDNNATNNAIMFGLSTGNGPNIIARDASSNAFVLRSYAISGVQLTLMKGGVSASAAAYASGGYGYLVRNATSGNFETRTIGISDVTGLQTAIDGKQATISIAQNTLMGRWSAGSGAFQSVTLGGGLSLSGSGVLSATGTGGTVTSVNIAPPTGFTAGAAVTTSGNITLSYAAGYALPTTAKQTAWDTAVDRWYSNANPTGNDLNNATKGGVLSWTNTTANSPSGTYGTVLTFVGVAPVGDGAATGTWINQLLASTGDEYYFRQSINNWSTWTTARRIWTDKHFSSTNVSQWNTAYGWGTHTGLYVPLARTVSASTGLSGGGSLGSNISLSVVYGTTAGTSAQGNDSRINNGQTAFSWGTHTGLYVPLARTVSAGTGLSGGGALNSNQTLSFNTTWGDARYSQVGHSHATLNPGTGISGNGYNGSSTQTWSISFGMSSGQAAEGNDSRINNGQTAFGWGNHAGAGYVHYTRDFYGVNSITGGGTMDANRYFQLVGDVSNPGNSKYYGTNGSGTRGWWDLPFWGGITGSGTAGQVAVFNGSTSLYSTSGLQINMTYGTVGIGKSGHASYSLNVGTMLVDYIGIGGGSYSGQAILEINSTSKGVLLPRISTIDWNSISAKPAGLVAWNSSENGFMWWDGTRTAIIRFNGTKYQGWTGSSWVDFH